MARSPSPPPPVVERRLVSVMFADLVGFTAWSAGRDPEDVRELLSTYFALARERIEHHGGTLEKFIGDAVMAVWGAPVAGEDDAEEAVLAALEVVASVRQLGQGMKARAAAHTGEVAVTIGAVGEAIVAGDVVNTAARLQAAADPGSVVVGAATMRAASSRIAFVPLGERVLKGKGAPLPVWRAIGPLAGPRDRDRASLVPNLVGRAADLDRVAAEFAAVATDSRARLVLLLGEAGVGKTRLARELRIRLASETDRPFGWFEGHSPTRGGVPFQACAEILRAAVGLSDANEEATARRKLDEALHALAIEKDDRDWVERAVLALLGMAPPPPGGRDALFAGWRIVLERVAAHQGPTVLAFEDLHEASSDLLDFIDHVVAWSKGFPIVVLGLGRPELLLNRPAWRRETRSQTVIRLDPLAPEAVDQLVRRIVPGLGEDVARSIVERADGLPLYAVERLRMLVVDGFLVRDGPCFRQAQRPVEVAVPETLRELIAARLDGAGTGDRRLLEDAAVLGIRFGLSALAAVSGIAASVVEERLDALVEREFVVPLGGTRTAGGGTYSFVHPLVQEVAYATLARVDRRERHLRAAGHFAALDDAEAVAAVAAHYLGAYRASRPGLETDELVAATRAALQAAAERAQAAGAPDQSVRLVEEALTLPMPAAEQAALLEIAAWSANIAGHRAAAEQYARRALACHETGGDLAGAARTTAMLSGILIGSGHVVGTVPLLERALACLPEGGPPDAEAALLAHLSRAYIRNGDDESGLRTAERALALAERLDLRDLQAEALVNKAMALASLGRDREAIELDERAIILAHAEGLTWTELRARANLGSSLAASDNREALAAWQQALGVAAKLGHRTMVVMFTAWVASGLRDSATDWDGARQSLEELLATDLEPSDRYDLEHPLLLILAARGELSSDQFAAHEALVAALADPQYSAQLEDVRAEFAWCRGEFETTVAAGLRAAEWPGATIGGLASASRGALWLRDRARLRSIRERLDAHLDHSPFAETIRGSARARLAGLEGRVSEAVVLFGEAIHRLRDMGDAFGAAAIALDLVRAVGCDVPEADQAADEARAVFERVRARLYLERLDAVMEVRGVVAPGPARRPA